MMKQPMPQSAKPRLDGKSWDLLDLDPGMTWDFGLKHCGPVCRNAQLHRHGRTSAKHPLSGHSTAKKTLSAPEEIILPQDREGHPTRNV